MECSTNFPSSVNYCCDRPVFVKYLNVSRYQKLLEIIVVLEKDDVWYPENPFSVDTN